MGSLRSSGLNIRVISFLYTEKSGDGTPSGLYSSLKCHQEPDSFLPPSVGASLLLVACHISTQVLLQLSETKFSFLLPPTEFPVSRISLHPHPSLKGGWKSRSFLPSGGSVLFSKAVGMGRDGSCAGTNSVPSRQQQKERLQHHHSETRSQEIEVKESTLEIFEKMPAFTSATVFVCYLTLGDALLMYSL